MERPIRATLEITWDAPTSGSSVDQKMPLTNSILMRPDFGFVKYSQKVVKNQLWFFTDYFAIRPTNTLFFQNESRNTR